MRKLFFLFLFAWIAIGMNAQRAVKETPPSFAYEQVAKAKLQSTQKLVIPFKVDALIAEDAKLEGLGFPTRVAKTIPASFTPENAGEWTTLPDGKRIWRLEINAPDANSISLLYDKFIIPNGGKLFIYDVDYKTVNVYTTLDNPKRQEYSTDFIPGDKIRLEYRPASEADGFQLAISGISYAYKDVIASLEAKVKGIIDGMEPRMPGDQGSSNSCEVNANCSEGEAWYHQKRGVAATLQVLSDGNYICSGTVINNALNDRTPYFLMAYHCGGEATTTQFNQWRFYFFWERTDCDNTSPLADYKMITGSTLKVGLPLNGASDGLLLELNQPIPRDWDVFFNGWDRRNTAIAGGGVGIHHPAGDVKKISTYTQVPASATANMSGGEVGAANAHWSVTFSATAHGHGVTEGGSSGSPLFNSDKRVIGSLTGGNSSCTNLTGTNIYGKMSWHWDQSPNPDLRMAKYLDPNGSGIDYIDGTYGEANLVSFTASKTNIWASEEITFVNRSYGDIDAYEWDFGANAVPASYSGQNPPTSVLYNIAGSYVAKLTAKKGSAIVGTYEVPITVTLKQNYCPAVKTIGTGTDTSSFPLGMSTGGNNRHSLSASIYTASELGLTSGDVITDLEWTANTSVSTARTLYIYLKEVDESSFAETTTWATEITDATLVYQSAASWTNLAGAVKVHLTTPFTYSGTKNLKVLVRASTTANVTTNAACSYTTAAANTHQQWANSTGTTPPTTTGIRNANRPNIRFYYNEPCGTEVPVANFIAAQDITLLKEGFDSGTGTAFPPAGWTIEKPGASANQWFVSNSPIYNFNTIDPSSTYSARIAYDPDAVVDTWLKTPAVAIDETGAKIEFYVLYSGSWLSGGATTFYVSDDGGTTWTQEWTTGNTNLPLSIAWRRQEVDLSGYTGQTVRFAWQYYGQDGDLTALDGIKVTLPNPEGKAVIYEGEFVNFTDLSTGPVVSWQWTLPGGNPSASTLSEPSVRYMNEGVYDAGLFVKNSDGTDSKTLTGAVTVKARTPVVQFASYSNGFIKQADFGQFLPLSGGPVEFENLTSYYPKTFAWTLPGADPASSTDESPEVVYAAGKNKYDVTLDAVNNGGTGSLTKTEYIQVGGTAEVWNVFFGENPLYRYTSTYAITGADLFQRTAERFEAPAGGEISKIRIYTSNVTQSSASYMTVQIFSDNGGVPGTAISDELRIQGGSGRIANGGYNTFTFTNPVTVSGPFHVAVGSSNYNTTYFTVPCVQSRANEYNTVSAYYYGTWYELTDFFDLYTSMNIIPEFTFTSADLTSPILYKKKNIDTVPETISFTTDGHAWTATADGWINLSAASGSVTGGNGSLTFTVGDNTIQALRKGTIKLYVAGQEFKIYVKQAGASPTDVTAEYVEDESGIRLDWVHEVLHYKPGDNIFDDAESYDYAAENPTGYYPWSYIDGDGAITYLGIPAAFLILDSDLDPDAQAHSGMQYFATIAASTPVNDWMISPELGFKESFTFSFWAKSLTNEYNGGERFRVAYSTGGKTQADFTNVLSSGPYVIPPLTWTKYTYTVPAAAKYVAINCVTDDELVFMVDDIYIGTGTAPASAPAQYLSKLHTGGLNIELLKAAKAARTSSATQLKTAKLAVADKVLGKAPVIDPVAFSDKSDSKEKASAIYTAELSDKSNFGKKASAIHPEELRLNQEALQQGSVLRASASAEEENEEAALQWHNGNPAWIYGNPAGGRMEAAVRFTPEDLVLYDEATLKAVEIYTYRSCENLTVNIRQGNKIVYSQPVGDITGSLLKQRIELTTPVIIDATQDLYVGYEYDQYAGDAQDVYVPIADDSPVVAGKGNLFSMNGGAFRAGPSGNWIITAYVEPATIDITFNVYRDGTLIAEGVTEKTYLDTKDLQSATRYCYTLTAVYGDPELESTESDPSACAYTPVIIKVKDNAATEFCAGGSVILSGPEVATYTYTWFKDSVAIAGETGSSLTVTQSGAYYLQVFDGTIELPLSNTIEVTVYSLALTPSISLLETAVAKAILGIDEPEEGVSYQWYRNSEAVGEPTTNTTYTLEESGEYYVVAVNKNGCESQSNTLGFTIITITADGSTAFCEGDSVILSAPRRSSYSYQWYKNEEVITGQTASFYIAKTSGRYTVKIVGGGEILSLSNAIMVAAFPRPATTPVISAETTLALKGETVAITVTAPQEGILYQWYKGTEALGMASASPGYEVKETGTYHVVASSESGCTSGKSNEISIRVINPLDLFSVPTNPIFPAGNGSTSHEVIVTISDPENLISTLGLRLYINTPDWITASVNGNVITFVAEANTTNAYRTGKIQVWYERGETRASNPTTGYEIEVGQKAVQIILFEAPDILSLEAGTYKLEATAGNGIEVIFGLRPEDGEFAEIQEGNVLRLKKEGTIVVTASAPGNAIFEDADNVSITIEIQKGTGIDNINSGKLLVVYPNPSRAGMKFYVASGLNETELKDAYIEVYNMSGVLIQKQKVTGKVTEMNLSLSGTYLFRLKGEETMIIIK
ncbi:hypothetical protein AGMMS50239_33330 [Bacteroidia bacterium]|nr:hypothetical protein AGMMS50239_33330 [Bacteroidia bacterium]